MGNSVQSECWVHCLSREQYHRVSDPSCSLMYGVEHLLAQSFQTASPQASQAMDVSEWNIKANAIIAHQILAVPTELQRGQGYEKGAGSQKG